MWKYITSSLVILGINVPYDPETLKQVAVALEIMDPRETEFRFRDTWDYEADLQYVRDQYRELLGAPLIHHADTLPDREVIQQRISLNRAWYEQLSNLAIMYPSEWKWAYALKEVQLQYQVYDAMRDASAEFYYVGMRRLALKRLRELVPHGDYDDVPEVPFWRFTHDNDTGRGAGCSHGHKLQRS